MKRSPGTCAADILLLRICSARRSNNLSIISSSVPTGRRNARVFLVPITSSLIHSSSSLFSGFDTIALYLSVWKNFKAAKRRTGIDIELVATRCAAFASRAVQRSIPLTEEVESETQQKGQ